MQRVEQLYSVYPFEYAVSSVKWGCVGLFGGPGAIPSRLRNIKCRRETYLPSTKFVVGAIGFEPTTRLAVGGYGLPVAGSLGGATASPARAEALLPKQKSFNTKVYITNRLRSVFKIRMVCSVC